MASYGTQMRVITDDVIGRFRPGDLMDVQETMQEITLRVILESVFGVPPGEEQMRLRGLLVEFLGQAMNPTVTIASILASGDRFRNFLSNRVAPVLDRAGFLLKGLPLARMARCVRELDALLYQQIAERRKVAKDRNDVMSMLIQAVDEEGHGLTDQELRDEMMVLLIGGHETTATTLTWSLSLALEHPEVAAAIRQEYERVFADRPWDPARIPELKYAEAVTKEALRLYPVAPAVGRRLKQSMTIAGYALPEGVVVSPSIYHIQRDPKLWPDPLKFDPMRFIDKKPRPTEWLPFGGGVRTCLGMAFSLYEMKVVLPTVLYRMELRLKGPLPKLAQRGILLGPSQPIRVTVDSVRKA
jgi:cytochrome P450 family 110